MKKTRRQRTKELMMIATAAMMLTACGNGSEKIQQTSASVQMETTQTASESKTTENTEQTTAGEQSEKRITPLPSTMSVDNLNDATFAVSFLPDDVKMDGEGLSVHMTVYDYEFFDMVDISQMEKGDVIVCNGVDTAVESIEREDNGMITINGGLENGGCYLMTDGDGVYYETGFDDAKTYYSIGETTLEADTNFVFTDNSDLENQGKTMDAKEFAEYVQTQSEHTFQPNNMSVRTENGKISEIVKNYMP